MMSAERFHLGYTRGKPPLSVCCARLSSAQKTGLYPFLLGIGRMS
jgi:hypothetical protein